MFSPTVSPPFTCLPGRSRGSKPSYCAIERSANSLERRRSNSVHQFDQVAVAVVLRALVVETVADLMPDDSADAAVVQASSASGSKNGGCRMPAGKQISFMPGL